MVPPALASRLPEGPHTFCPTPACPVVYHRGARTIVKGQLVVRVGIKEDASPRPVCYCFGHTVEEIGDEIRRTGRSEVPNDVMAKISAGLCACETMNPEGICCLGRVRAAVNEGMSGLGGATVVGVLGGEAADCCVRPVRAEISTAMVAKEREP